MPKEKKFLTIIELLYKHIDLYYLTVTKETTIRQNPKEHLRLVNYLNKIYQKELKKREQQFDYQQYENLFLERIELLTQVQKKVRDIEEREERNKVLKESIFSQRKPLR